MSTSPEHFNVDNDITRARNLRDADQREVAQRSVATPNDLSDVNSECCASRNRSASADSLRSSSAPNDMSEVLSEPWEYKSHLAPQESPSQYEKFLYFLSTSDVKEGRSYKHIANHFDLTLSRVHEMATRNNWQLRSKAFDDHRLMQQIDADRIQRHEQHLEKLEAFRKRSETLGTALITSGAQMLNLAHRTLAEMQANGETLDRKLLAGVCNAAAKVAESGRVLTGQSLGVDELINAFNSEDDD